MKNVWLKTKGVIIVVLSGALFASLAFILQVKADPVTRQAMKFKLHYAQGVLEAITTENYPLLATNALSLARLSQSEGWEIRQTAEYQRLTSDYKQAADNLYAAAQKENVDRATVAYFQLTVSCVNCHRYLRGAKMARQGIDPLPALIQLTSRNQPLTYP